MVTASPTCLRIARKFSRRAVSETSAQFGLAGAGMRSRRGAFTQPIITAVWKSEVRSQNEEVTFEQDSKSPNRDVCFCTLISPSYFQEPCKQQNSSEPRRRACTLTFAERY